MVHISWSTDFGRDDFARLMFLDSYNSLLYYCIYPAIRLGFCSSRMISSN